MPLETDKIDILLDADGDLVIGLNGDFEWTSGMDAVVQDLRIALLMVKGEWDLDLNEGLPWFANDVVAEEEAILGSKFDDRRIRSIIRTKLEQHPRVVEVLSIGIEFDDSARGLSVSFQVRTEFGDSPVVEVLA